MVVTGFLLWFQTEAMRHIPMWGLDVATIIHYYEAILATLAIIVWHLYRVPEPGFRADVVHLDRREALPARHGA